MYKRIFLIALIISVTALLYGCGDKEADIGKKLLAQGRYDEAVIHLKEAVRRHPSNPDLHYKLGLAYSGAGKYDKAIDQFQVALSFAPDRTDIQYEMAKAAWKLGRRLVPLKTFIKILKSNPTPKQEAEIRELAAEPHPVAQLTNTDSDNASPVFSPDGRQLAFVRVERGRNVVMLMDLSDRSVRRITPDGFSDSNPSFTPDGEHLILSSVPFPTGEKDKARLVKVNLRTLERETIFKWKGDIFKPALSPDGKAVLFESYLDDNWEIFKLDLATLKLQRLTDNRSNDIDPAFSPDGTKIIFASDRDGDFDIYEMKADGSSPRKIADSPGVDNMPSFSPDGRRILFVSDREGNEEIYVMDPSGKNVLRLTNYRGKDTTPCFSPDGKRVAFASTRGSSYLQINLMDMTKGLTRQELIKHLEYLASISWE